MAGPQKSSSVYGSDCMLQESKLPGLKKIMNRRNRMNGLTLLDRMPDCSVQAAFFDPQYRGILDRMKYGNEGVSRGRLRSGMEQMSADTVREFLGEMGRVLVPSGTLFLWIDKFHLVDGISGWIEGTCLNAVDMITWDKQRMGMGYRTRRCSEHMVVLQKSPKRAKNVWRDHGIPDVWPEKVEGRNHTHAKPVRLQARLIECVTTGRGAVLDPAAGGYSVLESCKRTGRNFIGCDLR
ncbi:DNA modification methylase [Cenarchaeum symbiosum A]|uniref:Type II methyltransferase n=1 Tax=Cenarchaeum symbiosum (strain A) TaxID=414004 RepID=A0RWR0_CENSY|nr:DNA modification methylase [Cenarchaeum symbiosum A]